MKEGYISLLSRLANMTSSKKQVRSGKKHSQPWKKKSIPTSDDMKTLYGGNTKSDMSASILHSKGNQNVIRNVYISVFSSK